MPTPVSANGLTVHVPSIADSANAMSEWVSGLYSVSLRISRPNVPVWSTNGVPIALSPLITVSPLAAAPGNITVTITCTPRLRSEQAAQTFLVFGSRSIAPASIATPVDPLQPTTLTFNVTGVSSGQYIVRLRVRGIDSLPVTLTGSPPVIAFDPQQRITVS